MPMPCPLLRGQAVGVHQPWSDEDFGHQDNISHKHSRAHFLSMLKKNKDLKHVYYGSNRPWRNWRRRKSLVIYALPTGFVGETGSNFKHHRYVISSSCKRVLLQNFFYCHRILGPILRRPFVCVCACAGVS